MEQREREIPRDPRTVGDGPDPAAEADTLDVVRARVDAMASAGLDAIRRGLSGDSERYVRSMRQEGGQ